MYFIGLDLAWGPVNRTGIAVLDVDGRLQLLASEITDEAIIATLAPYVVGDCLVAIDAPLLVTNDTGRRPAEAQLGKQFGAFQAGAYPAFTQHPTGMFDPPRGAVLAHRLRLDIDPQTTETRRAIEVYPHPATVALFHLGCTLKYKKGRGETAAARTVDRQREMITLLDHIESLATTALPLHVTDCGAWAGIRDAVQIATTPSQLNLAEDQIDAVLCAYVALLFARRPDQTAIFGNFPANGYIVTPVLPPGLKPDCPPATSSGTSGRSDRPTDLRGTVPLPDPPSDKDGPPTCPCGCGQTVRTVDKFVPGHDARALHQRITQQWGNTLGFLRWFDQTYGVQAEGNR